MALYSHVLAVGPFSKDIVQYLEYGDYRYGDTRDGTIVVVFLFGVDEGDSACRRFASCLGISDVWDFNQYRIVHEKIDLDALREFSRERGCYVEDADALVALMAKGFEFHFLPKNLSDLETF